MLDAYLIQTYPVISDVYYVEHNLQEYSNISSMFVQSFLSNFNHGMMTLFTAASTCSNSMLFIVTLIAQRKAYSHILFSPVMNEKLTRLSSKRRQHFAGNFSMPERLHSSLFVRGYFLN